MKSGNSLFAPVRLVFYILIFLFCSIISGWGQVCLSGDIVFATQAEVDRFAQNYPGCSIIGGGVIIESGEDHPIYDLQGLSQIAHIEGYLEVRNNKELLSLDGLNNLQQVDGRLTISGNTMLTSLAGLSHLKSIAESVRISSNSSLKSIDIFDKVLVIRGDLSIYYNNSLTKIVGFDDLIEIDGNVIIRENAVLSNLDGLQKLRKIRQDLLIQENNLLRDLSGFIQLQEIGQDFIVDNNASFTNLKGVEDLHTVGRYLQVVNNERLQSMTGLDSVQKIGGLLQIYNNPLLETLEGLNKIDKESIDNLAIIDCPRLADCAVNSICEFLGEYSEKHSISKNKSGCNTRDEILFECDRNGNSSGGASEVIRFYPNPTFGIVSIDGFSQDAEIVVRDIIGRILFKHNLENESIDLTHLAAGVYRLEILSKRRNLIKHLIKL